MNREKNKKECQNTPKEKSFFRLNSYSRKGLI